MGMATSPAAPPVADWPDRSVPPSAAYLASQVWTAERVRRELLRDYHPWPRYEFVDGELLVSHAGDAVSPSPTRRHQRAVVVLLLLLEPYVTRYQLGEVLTSPLDVSPSPDEITQPDVLVVPPDDRGAVSDESVTRLTLAAEVLSPSTARNDQTKKRALHARHNVEYWVVDCDKRVIEVTRPEAPSRVEPVDRELRWHPTGAPEPLVINVAAYFARVGGRGR
ncbi:hypothetical protein tb265_10050 [Gemmatimonadetes bacterium T265]|nr:hypothetical protein tb265_10050 [Gemmatimonadetes bacterium T265]